MTSLVGKWVVQTADEPAQAYTRPDHVHYWRGQVWGRRRRLLSDLNLWVSLVFGGVLTWLVNVVPGGDLEIADVGGAGLGYASIAFGACITGIVLVLSLPSEDRVRRWATTAMKGSSFSHYSDLVFVLSWSAIAQLSVILISLGGYLFGGHVEMAPDAPRASHIFALYGCMLIATYAFLQLFTVVSTLSQIAVVTIDDIGRRATRTDSTRAPAPRGEEH